MKITRTKKNLNTPTNTICWAYVEPRRYICTMASVKIYCRNDKKNKEGLSPVVIKLIHNRMIRSISTKVYIDFENEWDKKINKVKKGMHGSIRANEQIHYMYSKVYAIAAKLNSDEVHWDDISLDNTYELNAKKDFFQFGEDVKAKLEVK